MPQIVELPEAYRKLDENACKEIILKRKQELGEQLAILVHHYQRKEIVPFHDFLGDSFDLSAKAAAQKQVRYIVFCGVHFMAESADILSGAEQTVYLANPFAGCPMADMAPAKQVLQAWEELSDIIELDNTYPISYMNSTAELKAFCGRNKGLICTSSNADKAFNYVFDRKGGERVFFFPDQHLGRNTSNKLKIDREQVIKWNPLLPLGGHTPEAIRRSRVILWEGHCHVHMEFTLEQIQQRREDTPDIRIIVHPECREEVVQAADASGSTKQIVAFVQDQPAGSTIAIGTELNLVSRLADEYPDRKIVALSKDICPMCVNMYRTTLNDLAYTLDVMQDGGGAKIEVPAAIAAEARLALERMLTLE